MGNIAYLAWVFLVLCATVPLFLLCLSYHFPNFKYRLFPRIFKATSNHPDFILPFSRIHLDNPRIQIIPPSYLPSMVDFPLIGIPVRRAPDEPMYGFPGPRRDALQLPCVSRLEGRRYTRRARPNSHPTYELPAPTSSYTIANVTKPPPQKVRHTESDNSILLINVTRGKPSTGTPAATGGGAEDRNWFTPDHEATNEMSVHAAAKKLLEPKCIAEAGRPSPAPRPHRLTRKEQGAGPGTEGRTERNMRSRQQLEKKANGLKVVKEEVDEGKAATTTSKDGVREKEADNVADATEERPGSVSKSSKVHLAPAAVIQSKPFFSQDDELYCE